MSMMNDVGDVKVVSWEYVRVWEYVREYVRVRVRVSVWGGDRGGLACLGEAAGDTALWQV